MTRRAVVVLGLALATTGISPAHANPAAEKLFQDGRALLEAGNLLEACEAFRRSNTIEPRVGTLLNLADCEEKRGRIATAWEAFVSARALANRKADKRAAEAERRAGLLAAKLPFLTIKLPAERPAGLVVKRDDTVVPTAALDLEVAIDPGTYALEASAPGHVTWHESATLVGGQHLTIAIPALAADPAGTDDTGTPRIIAPAEGIATPSPPALAGPPVYRAGVGAAVGVTTDTDLIFGVRVPLTIAALGRGSLRVVPSLFYGDVNDPNDVDHHLTLYALGMGVEYVAPTSSKFAIAVGVGAGIDLISDNYEEQFVKQAWGAARLSPTLRIGRALDLGLHLQLVATADHVVGLGEVGLDYFFW